MPPTFHGGLVLPIEDTQSSPYEVNGVGLTTQPTIRTAPHSTSGQIFSGAIFTLGFGNPDSATITALTAGEVVHLRFLLRDGLVVDGLVTVDSTLFVSQQFLSVTFTLLTNVLILPGGTSQIMSTMQSQLVDQSGNPIGVVGNPIETHVTTLPNVTLTNLFALESGGNLATIVTNTTGLAKESGGNLAALLASLGAIGDSAWGLSGNGDAIAILKKIALLLSVTQPVRDVATAGYVAAFGSNATALTASTDYQFKWGALGTTQVNYLMLQNNTGSSLNWDLDTATSAGSPVLPTGQTLFLNAQVTTLHLQAAGTPNVNGTSSGNIVVRGWV